MLSFCHYYFTALYANHPFAAESTPSHCQYYFCFNFKPPTSSYFLFHIFSARAFTARLITKNCGIITSRATTKFFPPNFFLRVSIPVFRKKSKKTTLFAGTRVGVHYLPHSFFFSPAKSFSIETEVKNSNSQPINTNQDFKMVSAFVIGSLIIKTIKCHQFVDENMNMDSIRLLLIHILVLSGR